MLCVTCFRRVQELWRVWVCVCCVCCICCVQWVGCMTKARWRSTEQRENEDGGIVSRRASSTTSPQDAQGFDHPLGERRWDAGARRPRAQTGCVGDVSEALAAQAESCRGETPRARRAVLFVLTGTDGRERYTAAQCPAEPRPTATTTPAAPHRFCPPWRSKRPPCSRR